MKILLIHNVHYRGGGADVVYLNTGALLEKRGHTVLYFSFENKGNVKSKQEEYFVRQPGLLGQVTNNFYNVRASKQIERLIRLEKPDIAHLHSFWGGLTPSICLVLRRYGIPMFHTVHDYNLINPVSTSTDRYGNICEACEGRYFYKCALKRCFKGSFIKSLILVLGLYFRRNFFDPVRLIDGFIFVSIFAYNKHIKSIAGLDKSNSIILYNFGQNSISNAISSLSDRYFLYFGRLSHEKGLNTLISAFIHLKGLNLKVVGTGPWESGLRSRVINEGAENIEFLGYKSGKELESLISNSFFTVVPSEWWENNPMTIIESYSLGVPVIGSNVGGIPEIVNEGKTGFLFEMKNSEQLIQVLEKADSLSEEEYLNMSRESSKVALDKFNEEKQINRMIDFYNEIINKKNR